MQCHNIRYCKGLTIILYALNIQFHQESVPDGIIQTQYCIDRYACIVLLHDCIRPLDALVTKNRVYENIFQQTCLFMASRIFKGTLF